LPVEKAEFNQIASH